MSLRFRSIHWLLTTALVVAAAMCIGVRLLRREFRAPPEGICNPPYLRTSEVYSGPVRNPPDALRILLAVDPKLATSTDFYRAYVKATVTDIRRERVVYRREDQTQGAPISQQVMLFTLLNQTGVDHDGRIYRHLSCRFPPVNF